MVLATRFDRPKTLENWDWGAPKIHGELQKLGLLYCFFVIEHGRRRILRFNVTDHSTAEWSSNNCAKHSPKRVRIDMPSSIEIRRSMRKWSPS
jgi:hypothetical protein